MRAPRAAAAAAVLLATSLACAVSERQPDAPGATSGTAGDPTAVTGDLGPLRRALLSDPAACFDGRIAYCIDDQAFVDAFLRETLARRFDGVAPATEAEAGKVARRIRGSFRNQQLATPEARALVEARIAAYFASPDLEREQGLVRADAGLVPGRLEQTGRAGWSVGASDLLVRGELATKVVVERLTDLRRREPGATTVVLVVEVPATGAGTVKLEYRYAGNRDRVVVRRADRANQAWYTDKLGGRLERAGSVHTDDLATCTLKQAIWSMDPDCP